MLRTHTCGEITKKDIKREITLTGWVHRRRDHGGIIFIDLRDKYGLTQITFDPEANKDSWTKADRVRSEWVIKVTGRVVARPDNMINKKLSTGETEVECFDIEYLNKAKTPSFELDEEKTQTVNEHTRLKYRFIDLRRPKIQEMLKIKTHIRYNILGTVYLRAKQFEKAELYFNKSLKIDPFYAETWIGLGEIEAIKTNYSKFIKFFDVADKLNHYRDE